MMPVMMTPLCLLLLTLLVTLFFHVLLVNASKEEGSFAASKFKAPNNSTLPSVKQEWSQQDEALWKYIESHVPAVLEHTGASAFDEHLKGVQAVLRYWNAPKHVTFAGLFHSLYGTQGFQGFSSLPLTERRAIQEMIGIKAERLCWIFCMVDRFSVDETVFAWDPKNCENQTAAFTFTSRPELGRFKIPLESKEEWLDFLELSLADWLEQVEGAAETCSQIFQWKKGQAYAYRRRAYRKMSEILAVERKERLGEVVPSMLEAVMATESPETRQLHQEWTPPMSQAAKEALEALRSAGEMDLPVDFSPQPMKECEVS
jgi:hypothetical protein